jgi:hypothetical protein
MAENDKEMTPEEMIRKATWRSISIGILWIALVIAGIALERFGLTGGLFSGVLPGEVGALRQQISEERNSLSALTSERDQIKVDLEGLRKARESYVQCNNRLQELQENLP